MKNIETQKGRSNQFKGKTKQAVGNLTNDTEMKSEGMAQEVKGVVQEGVGKMKSAARGARRGLESETVRENDPA